MKSWKVWTFGSIGIVLLAAAGVMAAVWHDLSDNWIAETNAAQFALDHSPLNHIANHAVYSGPGGVEDDFSGSDTFHHRITAIVLQSGAGMNVVVANPGVSQALALAIAHRYVAQPLQAALGYLNPFTQHQLRTNAAYVWEVTYKSGAQYGYLYLNAESGQPVITLSPSTTRLS